MKVDAVLLLLTAKAEVYSSCGYYDNKINPP